MNHVPLATGAGAGGAAETTTARIIGKRRKIMNFIDFILSLVDSC